MNSRADSEGFRGSILDQVGGLVVLGAFVGLGPLFGPVGAITSAVMAVVGLVAAPMLVIGLIEAVREKLER